jgi:hypothetical protein
MLDLGLPLSTQGVWARWARHLISPLNRSMPHSSVSILLECPVFTRANTTSNKLIVSMIPPRKRRGLTTKPSRSHQAFWGFKTLSSRAQMAKERSKDLHRHPWSFWSRNLSAAIVWTRIFRISRRKINRGDPKWAKSLLLWIFKRILAKIYWIQTLNKTETRLSPSQEIKPRKGTASKSQMTPTYNCLTTSPR